jgi:hypothetical protein
MVFLTLVDLWSTFASRSAGKKPKRGAGFSDPSDLSDLFWQKFARTFFARMGVPPRPGSATFCPHY